MSKDKKMDHVNLLKSYELDEFRLNPKQLYVVNNCKTKKEKNEVIDGILQYNKYRVGESLVLYANEVSNFNAKTTKETLGIYDEIISDKNKEEVFYNLRKKMLDIFSETERALYLLSARMVSKDIIQNKIHKEPGFVVRFDQLVEIKAKEILEQRKNWKKRVNNYRSHAINNLSKIKSGRNENALKIELWIERHNLSVAGDDDERDI